MQNRCGGYFLVAKPPIGIFTAPSQTISRERVVSVLEYTQWALLCSSPHVVCVHSTGVVPECRWAWVETYAAAMTRGGTRTSQDCAVRSSRAAVVAPPRSRLAGCCATCRSAAGRWCSFRTSRCSSTCTSRRTRCSSRSCSRLAAVALPARAPPRAVDRQPAPRRVRAARRPWRRRALVACAARGHAGAGGRRAAPSRLAACGARARSSWFGRTCHRARFTGRVMSKSQFLNACFH